MLKYHLKVIDCIMIRDISSYPSSYPLPKMFRFVDFRGALCRRFGPKRMGSQLKHSYICVPLTSYRFNRAYVTKLTTSSSLPDSHERWMDPCQDVNNSDEGCDVPSFINFVISNVGHRQQTDLSTHQYIP